MQRIREVFGEAFGQGPPARVARAPGRVNLIGEHTDYNGGYVLPMAIDRWTEVALGWREDRKIRAFAAAFEATAEFSLPPETPSPAGGWVDYVVGVVVELSSRAPLERGFDVAIAGNVPLGAGLSSSAALEVALAMGLVQLYGIELPDVELVQLCQSAETDFVGTNCGIMDQYVALLAEEGCALLLDVAALRHRHVPYSLTGTELLVVDSGVRRALGQSGYNKRRRECQEALQRLNEALPSRRFASLRDVTGEDLHRAASMMPEVLRQRAEHVVGENERVLVAVDALEAGDAARLGDVLCASHASLRDLYVVSTPELDFLVEWGIRHGALGARLIGGGFGGATLHLVPEAESEDYARRIRRAYREETGRQATVMSFRPGPGAKELADKGDR